MQTTNARGIQRRRPEVEGDVARRGSFEGASVGQSEQMQGQQNASESRKELDVFRSEETYGSKLNRIVIAVLAMGDGRSG